MNEISLVYRGRNLQPNCHQERSERRKGGELPGSLNSEQWFNVNLNRGKSGDL